MRMLQVHSVIEWNSHAEYVHMLLVRTTTRWNAWMARDGTDSDLLLGLVS